MQGITAQCSITHVLLPYLLLHLPSAHHNKSILSCPDLAPCVQAAPLLLTPWLPVLMMLWRFVPAACGAVTRHVCAHEGCAMSGGMLQAASLWP
jgi:hypothetical protein